MIGLLVAATFTGGCDLLGDGSGEAPPWVGQWKVSTLDGDSPDRPRFWSITLERWTVVEKSPHGECKVLSRAPLLRRDGNVVTAEFIEDTSFRLRLTVSGDRLTSTLLDGPSDAHEVVTAEAVDFNPLTRLGG